jgi:hypothetical protein
MSMRNLLLKPAITFKVVQHSKRFSQQLKKNKIYKIANSNFKQVKNITINQEKVQSVE